ncbi:MAG TPA: helix-turn-helix domain-containing protein [Solirubrobacteraceae bacterium]
MHELEDLIRQARLDAGLTQAALATLAGTSQPAVARYEQGGVAPTLPTLERLMEACGRRVVISTTPANDTIPSPGAPRVPDMRLLRARRQRLLAAAARCGAREIRLFGSVSRGKQHPGSDIDLLVDLEPGRTLLDLAAFRRQASEVLGVDVDVATPDMLKEHIRAEALTQATPL